MAIADMTFGWQRFYEAAILETDRTHLPRRIETAQAAIDARMEQLQTNHHNSAEERQAIADALAGLRVLKGEIDKGVIDGGTMLPQPQENESN